MSRNFYRSRRDWRRGHLGLRHGQLRARESYASEMLEQFMTQWREAERKWLDMFLSSPLLDLIERRK